MNDLRTEHLEREAHVWAEFESAVDRIPRERWGQAGVLPEWEVSALLGHVTGWLDDASRHLEAMRDGTFEEEPEDGEDDTDDRNDHFAAAAREMDHDAVWATLVASREIVRQRLSELPDVTDRAIEEFASETYQHYREHIADLERFAAAIEG